MQSTKLNVLDVKLIIHQKLPQYSQQKMQIKHLSGLTNQTFKVLHQGLDTLVFRKFSPISDKQTDNIIFQKLQYAKIAPKCYFANQEYRIQQFIEHSKHPTLEELKSNQLKKNIILHMKQFHKVQVDIVKEKPLLIQYILSNNFLEKINKQTNVSQDQKFKLLYNEVTGQYQQLQKLRQKYLQLPKTQQIIHKKIRFCHNDLNNLNIFSQPSIIFIDYDYCNYNYLAYDIANFLNQSTINYLHDQFPYFKNQRKLTIDQIKQAAQLYPGYYEGLQKDIIKGLIICNLYWAGWSVLMVGDPSQRQFGTVQHGLMRMQLYKYYQLFL